MFENIGKKIRTVAVVFFVLGFIGAILASVATAVSIVYFFSVSNMPLNFLIPTIVSVIVFIVGVVLAWLGNLCLYGFGQLISDTTEIKEILVKVSEDTSETHPTKEQSKEAIIREVKILKDRLNSGEISPEQYNREIDRLKNRMNQLQNQ